MTGFRVKSPVLKVFKDLGKSVRASQFEPDVLQFLKRSLTTAVQITPMRSLSVIRRNQRKQYQRRVNYIPSFHELTDPSLRVNDNGEEWLYRQGKWYRPDLWHLTNEVWSDYETLNRERERRMNKSESEFIDERAQSRFLFKKTWWEIGQSAGIDVACPAQVKTSFTRRKPPLNPPRGYAQKRGGKDVFSVVVRNPFLDQTSAGGHTPLSTQQYKPFSGQQIINRAMDQHRPAFEKKVADRNIKLILKVLKFIAKII